MINVLSSLVIWFIFRFFLFKIFYGISSKTIQNLFYTCYYFTSFILLNYICWYQDWFWDTSKLYKGVRFDVIEDEIYDYYEFQLGYYILLLFYLFLEDKLKDFYQMLFHHIITIILIYFSLYFHHHRIGMIVFYIHDIVDFFLYFAKTIHHLNDTKYDYIIFLLFALTFFIFRILYFPIKILWPIFNTPEYSMKKYSFNEYTLLSLSLLILYSLHIIWFESIIKLFISSFYTSIKDPREGESLDNSP